MSHSGTADLSRLGRNALCSPLLRLPPEVRNSISAHAPGGYVVYIYAAPSQRRNIALHLLELFRQIYIEAHIVPFISNTFFCPSSASAKPRSPSLSVQIQAIMTVSFHAYCGATGTREEAEKSVDDLILGPFTGMRRLELLSLITVRVSAAWRLR